MLLANALVLEALAVLSVMVISDAARMGIDDWIRALSARALDEKLLVQVREKGMDRQKLQHLLSRALARGALWLAHRGEKRLRHAAAVRRRAPDFSRADGGAPAAPPFPGPRLPA